MRLRNFFTAGLVCVLVVSNATIAFANHRHNDRNNGEWRLQCRYGYSLNQYGVCQETIAEFCGEGINSLYDLDGVDRERISEIRRFASNRRGGCVIFFILNKDFSYKYAVIDRTGEVRLATYREEKRFNKNGNERNQLGRGLMYVEIDR